MEEIFMVTYRDDDKNKHIAFIQEQNELNFIKDRFDDVSIEFVDKKFIMNGIYPYAI